MRERFTYSFTIYPVEPNRQVAELFGLLATRIEMVFRPDDFDKFRGSVLDNGITLREIERVPYHEPETVL